MSGQQKRLAAESPAAGSPERHFHKAQCTSEADNEVIDDSAEVAAESEGTNATAAAMPPISHSPITPKELRYGTTVPEPPMPATTGMQHELKAVHILSQELKGCKDAEEKLNVRTIRVKWGQGELARMGPLRTFSRKALRVL